MLCRPPSGLVSHSDLDDRAIEALKEFNEEGALQVLLQFKDSDLSHVQVRPRRHRRRRLYDGVG